MIGQFLEASQMLLPCANVRSRNFCADARFCATVTHEQHSEEDGPWDPILVHPILFRHYESDARGEIYFT
jgi:hypothetical protein